MPTVPQVTQPGMPVTSLAVQPQKQTEVIPQPDRQQFARAVRQEVSQKGRVSVDFLDNWAVSHLGEAASNTPAAWDYALLRRSAQQEQTRQARQTAANRLAQEGNWVCQVGELAPDNASLQTYLSLQLPAYRATMEQHGLTPQQAQHVTTKLRTQTIEQHITRSLSLGDWKTAQRVLQAQGEHLPQPTKERFAQQVCESFTQDRASQLWQHAWEESGGVLEAAREQALASVEEPDEDLRAAIQVHIQGLAKAQQKELSKQQADLWDDLAQADEGELSRLLGTQQVLDGAALVQAQRAAAKSHQSATGQQRAWFVKNYFNPKADIDKAFEKDFCAPRDYFRLRANQKRREAGQASNSEVWLCRNIRAWMQKQKLGEQDITQATYDVLSGARDEAGQVKIWQRIKTLLTY